MASVNLKQRVKGEPAISTTTNNNNKKKAKKMAMAKRGLRSLTIAISVPVSLAIFNIYFFLGSNRGYYAGSTKPFWYYPPIWLFDLGSLFYHCIMGLSAWLTWADGGFHRQPIAAVLFLAQLALSLAWGPVVLVHGASHVGLVIGLALFASLFGCQKCFASVNPISSDLVKPCLFCVGFLAFVNFRLL